jgi:hypothetical protein
MILNDETDGTETSDAFSRLSWGTKGQKRGANDHFQSMGHSTDASDDP